MYAKKLLLFRPVMKYRWLWSCLTSSSDSSQLFSASCFSVGNKQYVAVCRREPKQKRKRAAGSGDQPKRTKQKKTGNDTGPGGGANQAATAVANSHSSQGQKANPQRRPEDKAVGPSQGLSVQQPSSQAPGDAQQHQHTSQDVHGQKDEDPSPIGAVDQEASQDQKPNARQSIPLEEEHGKEDSPEAADKGQPQGSGHELDRMVEHLSGHLPSSADEEAAREEEEGEGTEDESTDSDGKHSQPDIDVVN